MLRQLSAKNFTVVLLFLVGKAFAGPTPTPAGGDFYDLHIPCPSATWKSTLVYTRRLDGSQGKKVGFSFWYKNGKLKRVNNTPGDLPGKKFFVEILTRDSLVQYSLPQGTGYRYPPDCWLNLYYHAPGSYIDRREAGMQDSGESERVGGMACEIYQGSPSPDNIPISKDNYYKEWRAKGGFVMKRETRLTGPKSVYNSVEEVSHFKANAAVPDSVFDVPATIQLGDGAQWLKDHALKPQTFFQKIRLFIKYPKLFLEKIWSDILRGR